jgi:hypothetical protein
MSFLFSHVLRPTHLFRAYHSNTISPLFRSLLGPSALLFHHIYLEYLRATNAMEHVLLAFVRWRDAPGNDSSGLFGDGPGSAASISVLMRLKDCIRGYPTMPPEPVTRSRKHDRLNPRPGARTVRVVSVRRNVRMYTPDLFKDRVRLLQVGLVVVDLPVG